MSAHKLIPKKEFDRYYNMNIEQLNKIDIGTVPYLIGELIMILTNPREEDETYEYLKRVYCENAT